MTRSAVEIVADLEQACVAAEQALSTRDWSACTEIWQRQRALTHELGEAVRKMVTGSTERASIDRRIERIVRYRDGQLRRLESYRSATADRLATFGRFRQMGRTVAQPISSQLLDTSR